MVLRLSLYTSQSPGGTQTIPIHITVSLEVLRLSLYSTKSLLWYSDYSYAHHSLPGGTQTITMHITVSLGVLRLSLYSPPLWWHWYIRPSHYSSQSPRWYSDYPYEHHSLPGGTQTTPTLITVSLRVLRLSLYS